MSNKNPQNQFPPGVSGNPKGRPKREWTWAGLLEEIGENVEPKSKKKFKELVGRKLWVMAANGDAVAIKEIFNRMDGMPKQSTDLTSGGKPIPIMGGTSNVHRDNGLSEDPETD